MRNIILCLAVSLDGFIEGPNGELDWIEFDSEGGSALTDFIKEIDTIFYGRISYEKWGNPPITEDSSEFEKSFYGTLKKMDRYVFSTTIDEFEGDPTVVKDNIAELVEDLRRKPGKDMWLYGGAELITAFMNLDLVDEYRIAVMPVIIGKGKPLFKDIEDRHKLKLVKANTPTAGILELHYRAVR